MNLETFYLIPIILVVSLVCVSIFIANFEIEDDDVDSYFSKVDDFQDQIDDTRSVFESRTTERGLSGVIEEIPIFGGVVKVVKFISSIVGTLRSGVDLTIGFFSDVLGSEVLYIDSRIIGVLLAGIFGLFGFAVFKTIRSGS